MSDTDTTAWRQRAERCDDRVRELREEMARRDEQIAAVRALMAGWLEDADSDERWANGPHVSVSEAHEYPALVTLTRLHAKDLTEILDGGAS